MRVIVNDKVYEVPLQQARSCRFRKEICLARHIRSRERRRSGAENGGCAEQNAAEAYGAGVQRERV